MKAISVKQFGTPQVLEIREVADPQPGPQDVIVQIKAAGVNPVETYIRSGEYANLPTLPWTPGSDGSGDVVAVGDEVERWKVGDRVYTTGSQSGTYAELASCNQDQLQPLPSNVDYAAGACLGIPYATAQHALLGKARQQKREMVLIHGASGGVGLAAVQIAKAAGLKVIGTASTPEGANLIEEQGADYVFNHHHPDYRQEILGTNCGRGVDIILEMRADINLGHDLRLLAMHGRIVIIGCRDVVEINPRDAMRRDAVIYGLLLTNASEEERKSTFEALNVGLENGTLKPVIRQTVPLAEASKAHELVMQPGAAGNVILVP
ncbi:MAG: NADPH:quinone reductase [Abditibacteriaceae bacterium]